MIKAGDRVQIKAITRRDAYHRDYDRPNSPSFHTAIRGKIGTVVEDLYFDKMHSTWSGRILLDYHDDLKYISDSPFFFAAVQLKKIKEE